MADQATKFYKLEEIAKHTEDDDCWIIIHGKVYDVTDFMDAHPGGPEYLTDHSGGEWRRNLTHTTRPPLPSLPFLRRLRSCLPHKPPDTIHISAPRPFSPLHSQGCH